MNYKYTLKDLHPHCGEVGGGRRIKAEEEKKKKSNQGQTEWRLRAGVSATTSNYSACMTRP